MRSGLTMRERLGREGRAWLVAVVFLLLYAVLARGYDTAAERSRTFRDVVGLTPFREVTMDEPELHENGLAIAGDMKKVRCEFRGLSAYVQTEDGRRFRVAIDTTPENLTRPPGNRAPGHQAWGVWLIRPPEQGRPVHWQVFATHQCPGETTEQVNLFAEGPWP